MSLTRDYIRSQVAHMNHVMHSGTADVIVMADRPDLAVAMIDDLPGYLPAEYQARVFNLLVMAYINALNKKAQQPMKMAKKHVFLARALDCAKSRER